MKAALVPIHFKSGMDTEFKDQLATIRSQLADVAEFLPPVELGKALPESDAVVFPQLIGDAFKQMDQLLALRRPMIVITSEFCTVAMWDWEIVSLLKARGAQVFTPYTMDQTRTICAALGARRQLRDTKFLVFQDDPGEGMQAGIFKRFYWWERECTEAMGKKFGVEVEKRSFKKLGEDAKLISNTEADRIIREEGLSDGEVGCKPLRSAVKMYLALKKEIAGDKRIRGAGINCLNESMYSDTTPCLAWDILFRETGLLWSCEADTMSLLTEYIMHGSLGGTIMMSNIYPFLMGMAALKHEKISSFPQVEHPENHALIAHCGYFGIVCSAHASRWRLAPKVLGIVDDNATAIDAELPVGMVTLAKASPLLDKLQIIPAEIVDYAGYPGSDCRNGAVLRFRDGRALMDSLYSHHQCFTVGDKALELGLAATAFGMEAQVL
jgi:hypothetical protein